MAFKYINPGLNDLFDIKPNIQQSYDNTLLKSRTNGNYVMLENKGLYELQIESATEYWCAFYWYIELSSSDDTYDMLLLSNDNNGIKMRRVVDADSKTTIVFSDLQNNSFGTVGELSLKVGDANHIEIYIKDDTANGCITMWVNGKRKFEFMGHTGSGQGVKNLKICAGSKYSLTRFRDCLSDIVVQNTGRIGDLRINQIPAANVSFCDFDAISLTMGSPNLDGQNTAYDPVEAYVLADTFEIAGKITNISVPKEDRGLIKFFLVRKNAVTNKYNYIDTTREYEVADGANQIKLDYDLNIQTGDRFGYCFRGSRWLGKEGIEYYHLSSDAINSTEFELPTNKTTRAPCLQYTFTPDDTAEAVKILNTIIDPDLLSRVTFTTNTPDKLLLSSLDVSKLKLGRIDSIAITDVARYEGESGVKKLSYLVKSGANEYEGTPQELTTADKLYCFGAIDKDPSTGLPWTTTGIAGMQIGVKAKA